MIPKEEGDRTGFGSTLNPDTGVQRRQEERFFMSESDSSLNAGVNVDLQRVGFVLKTTSQDSSPECGLAFRLSSRTFCGCKRRGVPPGAWRFVQRLLELFGEKFF